MSLKSIIQDMRDGAGSISLRRKSLEARIMRSRSHNDHYTASNGRNSSVTNNVRLVNEDVSNQSVWANLPAELLSDVVKRVEETEREWPCRRSIVACAGVCKSWRLVAKELVLLPSYLLSHLTFPSCLKQPGTKDNSVQCFIKRDRNTSTYFLYLCLTPTNTSNGKFLLAAQRVRRATSTEYIVSFDPKDISRDSSAYVGKLRSNFFGTSFTIYDNHPPPSGATLVTNHSIRRVGSKQIFPKVPSGSYNIAHITYELNVLGARGPRRMQCIMHSIPASMTEGKNIPVPVASVQSRYAKLFSSPSVGSSSAIYEGISSTQSTTSGIPKVEPLILKNKAPRWHEQLQCWCLNFKGRVTVASVKNFQLVAAVPSSAALPTAASVPEPNTPASQSDSENVILQFGKVEKDVFTMDYCYPLSAFQAFAISLSSFDTKLACE